METVISNTDEKYSEDIWNIIDKLSKLLIIWSTDFYFNYKIRSKDSERSFNEVNESYVRNEAKRCLERIEKENIIIIPNGLTNHPEISLF